MAFTTTDAINLKSVGSAKRVNTAIALGRGQAIGDRVKGATFAFSLQDRISSLYDGPLFTAKTADGTSFEVKTLADLRNPNRVPVKISAIYDQISGKKITLSADLDFSEITVNVIEAKNTTGSTITGSMNSSSRPLFNATAGAMCAYVGRMATLASGSSRPLFNVDNSTAGQTRFRLQGDISTIGMYLKAGGRQLDADTSALYNMPRIAGGGFVGLVVDWDLLNSNLFGAANGVPVLETQAYQADGLASATTPAVTNHVFSIPPTGGISEVVVWSKQVTQGEYKAVCDDLKVRWPEIMMPTDGSWSWWTNNQATSRTFAIQSGATSTTKRITTLGSALGNGSLVLFEIDESTNKVIDTFALSTTYYPIDDHHAISIINFSDGSSRVIYTGHGTRSSYTPAGSGDDGTVWFRDSPTGRIADYGPAYAIPITDIIRSNYLMTFSPNGAPGVTYGLVNDDTSVAEIPFKNIGGVVTQGRRLVNFTNTGVKQIYCNAASVDSTEAAAWLFIHTHATNTRNPLYLSRIDFVSGDYTVNGSVIGNAWGAYNGAALSELTTHPAIYTPPVSNSMRMFDALADSVVFVEFIQIDGSGAQIFELKFTGSDRNNSTHWTKSAAIVNAGTQFYASSHYFGGARYLRRDGITPGVELVICRENAGTYYVDLYTKTGGTWTFTRNIASSATEKLLRPIAVRDGVDIDVFWQQVFDYTGINDFAMRPQWATV